MDASLATDGERLGLDPGIGGAIAASLSEGALPGETDGLDENARAEAGRFVAEAANLHPALPVQATSAPRMLVASECSPRPAMPAVTGGTSASGMSEMSSFCHTVRRIVPLP